MLLLWNCGSAWMVAWFWILKLVWTVSGFRILALTCSRMPLSSWTDMDSLNASNFEADTISYFRAGRVSLLRILELMKKLSEFHFFEFWIWWGQCKSFITSNFGTGEDIVRVSLLRIFELVRILWQTWTLKPIHCFVAFDSGTDIITLNSQTFGLAARNTRAASWGGYQQYLG